MSQRIELREASDAAIEDAIRHADPMVLRGLLYQLTGDESLASMKVMSLSKGNADFEVLADKADAAAVRAKAVEFLKRYRDAGAGAMPLGPRERLAQSVRLTAGFAMDDAETGLWIEQLGVDPFARGLAWKAEPPAQRLKDFKVAVIGAGMGGLNAAVLLKQAGVPFFVIEKNAEVGGTWYENRYPGARVDSPSRTYTHLFGADFIHPYAFCPQEVNQRYFEWVADRYAIRPHVTFDTEVSSIVWDEDAAEWEIRGRGPSGPRSWRAHALITAVGFLSRPNLPSIEGMGDFKGLSFHTARWPRGLDLAGRRVAVIGTGATGYQTIPEIAKVAGRLHVFQRTPGWCFDVPGYLAPLPPQVNWLDRNFPWYINFARLRTCALASPQHVSKVLTIDPGYRGDPQARGERNRKIRDDRITFIRRCMAARPELAEKMIPPYPPMAARHILVDEKDNVYTALTRDNVELVTEAIERVTAAGIVAGGREIPLDVIVYATGFRANDFLWPLEVRGRGGRRVEDLWAEDGPRAYLGTMLPGFPNFFMVYGPNTNNFGGLQIVDFQEMAVRFALNCVGGLIEQGRRAVEVSAEAYRRYNAELDRCEARMLYTDPRANTYYRTRHGRSAANNPIDIRRIWAWTRDPAGPPAGPADAGIEPHFGADLKVS